MCSAKHCTPVCVSSSTCPPSASRLPLAQTSPGVFCSLTPEGSSSPGSVLEPVSTAAGPDPDLEPDSTPSSCSFPAQLHKLFRQHLDPSDPRPVGSWEHPIMMKTHPKPRNNPAVAQTQLSPSKLGSLSFFHAHNSIRRSASAPCNLCFPASGTNNFV